MQACEYSYTLIDLVSTRFSLIIIFTIMYIFQIHLTLCNSANMYFTYMQQYLYLALSVSWFSKHQVEGWGISLFGKFESLDSTPFIRSCWEQTSGKSLDILIPYFKIFMIYKYFQASDKQIFDNEQDKQSQRVITTLNPISGASKKVDNQGHCL